MGDGVYLANAGLASFYATPRGRHYASGSEGIIPVKVKFTKNTFILAIPEPDPYKARLAHLSSLYNKAYNAISHFLPSWASSLLRQAHIANAAATLWVRESAQRFASAEGYPDSTLAGIAVNRFQGGQCLLSFLDSYGDGGKDISCLEIIKSKGEDFPRTEQAFNDKYKKN